MPPLFHLGVILAFVTGTVTAVALACAWAFVGFRLLHTFIHLGSNDVTVRFFTFGLSLFALLGLWGSVLSGLQAA